jgi:hypothetical protein
LSSRPWQPFLVLGQGTLVVCVAFFTELYHLSHLGPC